MRLCTLGGLRLEQASFQRPKALLLLCFLALEGPQERGRLAALFWPAAVRGRSDLSTTLSRLRKFAPGSVEADAVRVWTPLDCDARALLAAAEAGDHAEALTLYRGRFLDGFDGRGLGAELEEWVYGTREVLAGRVLLAQLGLAEEAATAGRFEEAARGAEAALRLGEGGFEPEVLLRLHGLLLAGGSPEASALRKEAEGFALPLAQSEGEARERLRERPGSTRVAPHNLPGGVTSFVGRALEMAEVAGLLGEHRLVTLLGPGGVGKSRLALQAARRELREGRHPDGVYLVAMDALPSAAALPASVASAIGLVVDAESPASPLEQIARRLAERRVLLAMDNFEHLIDGATLVAELLRSCPQLTVLTTSRRRLELAEEWVYEVGGLAYPEGAGLSAEECRAFDAVQLFGQRARQANPDFLLDGPALAAVVEITRLVEGLPLALELAAAWVRATSAPELAADLARGLDEVLATPKRDVEARHRTARASFEHSWRLLDAGEGATLARLSTFRGGFRREAAAAVAGATLPGLAGLVDKSLLRLRLDGRYDRHPLVYRYSREKLAERPMEEAAAGEAHSRHFLQRIAAFDPFTFAEAMVFFTEELENARAAWDWAVARGRVDLLEGCAFGYGGYFLHSSRFQEGLDAFARTVERLERGGSGPADSRRQSVLGECLCMWGWLGAWSWMDPAEAVAKAERGLALLGAPTRETVDVVELGREARWMALTKLGRLDEARSYAEASLALAESLEAPFWMAQGRGIQGVTHMALGNLEEAARWLEASIALAKSLDIDWYQVTIAGFLAQVYLAWGKLGKARELCEASLPIARALGHQRLQVILAIDLGDVALARGEPARARVHYQEALEIARERDVDPFLAELSWGLGRAHLALGNYREAQSFLRQHLEVRLRAEDRPLALRTLLPLAEACARRGQHERARAWLQPLLADPAAAPEDAEGARALLGELAGGRVPDAPPGGTPPTAGLEAVAAALLGRPP